MNRNADPGASAAGQAARRPTFALLVAGSICAVLGLTVLAGWHTRTVGLIRIFPTQGPMVYNTALALLLAGIGLIAADRKARGPVIACGGLTTLIGLLALAQDLLGVRLGMDEWLVRDFVSSRGFPPGRMTAAAAVCITLTGAALLLMAAARLKWRPLILGVAGSVICSLGLMALFSHVSGMIGPHQWGRFTPMAVPSAAGFLTIGSAIMLAEWQRFRGEQSRPFSLAPLLVAAGVLTATFYFWYALRAWQETHVGQSADLAAAHVKADLRAEVESRLLALVRMARRWELHGQGSRADWESDAAMYLDHYAGYYSLSWVDPSFQVRWSLSTSPKGWNRLPDDTGGRIRAALERARDTRQATVSHSVTAPTGEKLVLLSVPLLRQGEFAGYIAGVFRVRALLDSTLLGNPGFTRYSVAIFDGGEEIYSQQSESAPAPEWTRSTTVDLRGTVWVARLTPRSPMVSEQRSLIAPAAVLFGFLTAGLSSLALHLARTARMRAKEAEAINRKLHLEIAERKQAEAALAGARDELEQHVQERTAELAKANVDLKAEIAERNRAEDTLRASEQRYRELFDNARDLVYTHDLHGNFTALNRAAQQITGYSRDEALQMNLAQLVAPEHLELAQAMIARNLGGETNATYELAIVAKGGRRLMLELSTHLVYRHGKPVAVEGIARDITERKRLEEELTKSEAKYRSLVEETSAGIATVDTTGKFTFVNEAICQMFGYSRQEILGKPFAFFLHPDDKSHLLSIFQVAPTQPRKKLNLEFRGIDKQGNIIHLSSTPTVIRREDKIYGFGAIM